MAFHPLFYQLLLIALGLICLLGHVGLPNDPPRVHKTPIKLKPRRRTLQQLPSEAVAVLYQNNEHPQESQLIAA
jgi:hypothetical protein